MFVFHITFLAEVAAITIVEVHLQDTVELVLLIIADVAALITMTTIVIDVIRDLPLTELLVVEEIAQGVLIANAVQVLITMIMEEEVRVHMGMF